MSRFLDDLVRNYAKRISTTLYRPHIEINLLRLFLGFLSWISEKYDGCVIYTSEYRSAIAGACHRYGNKYTRGLGILLSYTNASVHDEKCDVCMLYIVLTCFAEMCVGTQHCNGDWLQLGYRWVEGEKDRCDNNCIFNGAGYTLVSRIFSRK